MEILYSVNLGQTLLELVVLVLVVCKGVSLLVLLIIKLSSIILIVRIVPVLRITGFSLNFKLLFLFHKALR